MAIVYNSTKTADTINRAIDNSMGTTTTTQGAAAAGKIITEDLQPVVQCTGGYTNPFIVKSISGVPPVEFHAVEGALKFWAISGNTVEGVSVGDRTKNLIRCTNTTSTESGGAIINQTAGKSEVTVTRIPTGGDSSVTINVMAELTAGTYTFSIDGLIDRGERNLDRIYLQDENNNVIINNVQTGKPRSFTITEDTTITKLSLVFAAIAEYNNQVVHFMLNTGDTAKPFEPYGFNVPIVCANVTYNCYISDVLRKSTPATRKRKSKKAVNDTTVYDVMDSTGTVYRNVDTDGTPLETPTTETYTAPTITTIWGYNEFDVDTTVTPSNVTVQYYDN